MLSGDLLCGPVVVLRAPSDPTCFPSTIFCLASLWVWGRSDGLWKSPRRSRPPSQAGDIGKQHTGWEESSGVETSHKDTDVHGRGL